MKPPVDAFQTGFRAMKQASRNNKGEKVKKKKKGKEKRKRRR